MLFFLCRLRERNAADKKYDHKTKKLLSWQIKAPNIVCLRSADSRTTHGKLQLSKSRLARQSVSFPRKPTSTANATCECPAESVEHRVPERSTRYNKKRSAFQRGEESYYKHILIVPLADTCAISGQYPYSFAWTISNTQAARTTAERMLHVVPLPWHVKSTFERGDQSSPRPDLFNITCHSTTILIVLASISDYVLRRYLSVRQCAQAGTQTYACRTPPELQRRETHEISFLLSCAGQQIDERLSSAKVAPLTCTELALPDHSCLHLVRLLLPPPQH